MKRNSLDISELQKDIEKFENWSKICIKHIQQILDQKAVE